MSETHIVEPKKIWYDLEFQKIIESTICSCIFFKINSLIQRNIYNGEKAPRFKCFSHLGMPGVCITYNELAESLHIDRARIAKAMTHLKNHLMIGMDYVILENMRAPFLFIESQGQRFVYHDKCNLRYGYSHVVEKFQCFDISSVHGHIAYCNERSNSPLVQSTAYIGKAVGLSYKQAHAALRKLMDSGLVLGIPSKDGRYSLTALEAGSIQKGVWGQSKMEGGVNPKEITHQSKTVDNITPNSCMQKTERESTLCFFAKEEEQKRREEKGTFKEGFLEISTTEYNELVAHHGLQLVRYSITRYNAASEEKQGILPGLAKMHLLRYISYALENAMLAEQKEKRQRKEIEEKILQQSRVVELQALSRREEEQKKENAKKRKKEEEEEPLRAEGCDDLVLALIETYKCYRTALYRRAKSQSIDPSSPDKCDLASGLHGQLRIAGYMRSTEAQRLKFIEVSGVNPEWLEFITHDEHMEYTRQQEENLKKKQQEEARKKEMQKKRQEALQGM